MFFSRRFSAFLPACQVGGFLVSIFVFLMMAASCKFRQGVTMVVHHANIYTADKDFSVKQAMAIRDGKIIAVGSNDEILKEYDADEMKDAEGKFIYPGFIDAHCHFTGYATDMWKCDVTGTSSFDEIIEALKKYAATAKTTWLYGRGWDQNDWAVKEFPDKKNWTPCFQTNRCF